MGVMTYFAAARCDGAVHPLFVHRKGVAVNTETLYGHQKLVRAPLMAALAQLGGVRAMFGIVLFFYFTSVGRCRGDGIFAVFGRSCCLVGVGHAVKENAQHPVSRPRFASGEHSRAHDENDYAYCHALVHGTTLKRTKLLFFFFLVFALFRFLSLFAVFLFELLFFLFDLLYELFFSRIFFAFLPA